MPYYGLTMKNEFLDPWLKDLRSDSYKQGKDFLALSDGTYCCLGVRAVGCGIVPHFPPNCDDEEFESGNFKFPDGSVHHEILPTAWFADQFDFNEALYDRAFNPTGEPMGEISTRAKKITTIDDLQTELAEMNDAGKSFAEIADWIEANLRGAA